MKQYKTAIIAIFVIAIACVAFFAVKHIKGDTPAATEAPENSNSGYVFPFSTDSSAQTQIVGIDCVGTEHLTLEKQNNSWVCTTYPELEVSKNSVDNLIARLYNNNGAIVYEGEVTPEVRNDFGLDGQTKLMVTMKDGTTYTAIFGGLNTASTAQYVWLEGAETIYL